MITDWDAGKLPQGYYTQSGTVLKRRESSKDGQSLLLFMRDLGPRWVQAPAASGKNRFGGAAEPLVWSEYNLYQSPSALYLKGAEVREDFIELRSSAESLMTALGFYRLISGVVMTAQESNELLKILWSAMTLLRGGTPPAITDFRFTWRLLNALGLAPSLTQCVLCGSVLDGGAVWTEDGLACAKCSAGAEYLSAAELSDVRSAALLPYEKFISWSKARDDFEIYHKQAKKLITFFGEIR